MGMLTYLARAGCLLFLGGFVAFLIPGGMAYFVLGLFALFFLACGVYLVAYVVYSRRVFPRGGAGVVAAPVSRGLPRMMRHVVAYVGWHVLNGGTAWRKRERGSVSSQKSEIFQSAGVLAKISTLNRVFAFSSSLIAL